MEAGTPTCEMASQIFATSFSWAGQLMKFQDETAVNRDQKWVISIQFLGRNLFVSICPSSSTKKKQFFRELGWTYGGSFAGDSHDIIAGLEESPFHPYTWSPNARGKCRIKNNNIKRKHSLPYPGSEIIVFLYVGSLKKEL